MNIKLNTERCGGQGSYNLGNFQINYLFGLNDLCKKYLSKEKTVLELGAYDGVSTSLFAFYCKKVITIDYAKRPNIDNLLLKNKNIEFYNMDFYEFLKIDKDNQYDLVYVDGSHIYADILKDVSNFLIKVKKGGCMSGHDCNDDTPDVLKAIKELFPNNEIEIFSDSSWLVNVP
jgi:hypothetical protein